MTNQQQLYDMATLSLKQRAAFANVKFGTDIYNAYRVRKIFREGGIRLKKIRTRNAPSLEVLNTDKYHILHIEFR